MINIQRRGILFKPYSISIFCMGQSNLGFIGLAVMGSNLARNFASCGFVVSVYNRTAEHTKSFIKEFGSDQLTATYDYQSFVKSLEHPRKIIIMVKAGASVDAVINDLTPYLESGDIIIDGGNSFYRDTQRRFTELQKKNIEFVGMGVSGGEKGALHGPSIMPGGDRATWSILKPILEPVAAKDFSGKPCVTYIGPNGAGHYVKMIHNGIEYAVMQLMSESYGLLKNIYGLKAPAIATIFEKLYQGKLNSFLFEIAIPVLKKKDDLTGHGYLIDKILDRAGSKGTGQWTSVDALTRSISIATITESVFARYESAAKDERVALAKLYKNQKKGRAMSQAKKPSLKKIVPLLENALYAAMISCYAQGYDLIQKTAAAEQWDINMAEVTRIWQGGCIIRAKLLNVIHQAYQQNNWKSGALFAVPGIMKLMKKNVPDLRLFVSTVGGSGSSIPAFTSALFYFQNMISSELPTNFIQGLRDFFGAHGYERTDKPGSFHTEW